MNKAKKKIKEESKEITYRLALLDSENRAVYKDITLKELEQLNLSILKMYYDLLDEEVEKVEASLENDKQVEKKVKNIHKEKQDELVQHSCFKCQFEWKGGDEKCPDCGNVEGNIIIEKK